MRALAVICGVFLVAGCAGGPPPQQGYYRTPAARQPAPSSEAYRPSPQRVASAPRPVKPIGAGVLASNAVEGYMDNQENELRTALHGSGIIVARTGNALLLNIRDDQLFEPSSSSLSSRGTEVLDRIASDVRKFDSTLVVINAYTDTTGTGEQNLAVSQKRAETVGKQLVENGVEQKRVSAKGFGDEILKIPTGPNVSEPRNRRIEMRITPLVKS